MSVNWSVVQESIMDSLTRHGYVTIGDHPNGIPDMLFTDVPRDSMDTFLVLRSRLINLFSVSIEKVATTELSGLVIYEISPGGGTS